MIKLDADQTLPDAREEGPSLKDLESDGCPGPASSSLGSDKELALSYKNLRLACDLLMCLCIIMYILMMSDFL